MSPAVSEGTIQRETTECCKFPLHIYLRVVIYHYTKHLSEVQIIPLGAANEINSTFQNVREGVQRS